MTFDEDWRDVASEYRHVFRKLDLTEDDAREIIIDGLYTALLAGILADADMVADALKEFVVRAEERGEGGPLRDQLRMAVLQIRPPGDLVELHALAGQLFGIRAEDLGTVLHQLKV